MSLKFRNNTLSFPKFTRSFYETRKPRAVLGHDSAIEISFFVEAAAGFANGDAVAGIEERGIEVLVAVSRPDNERIYDFRRPRPDAKMPPEPKAEWRKAMKDKLHSETAKAKYKRRKSTVEAVFGIINNVLGFNRFSMRGPKKSKPNGSS